MLWRSVKKFRRYPKFPEQFSPARKQVMRVQDLDDPQRRVLEGFCQKSIIDDKDIKFFTPEQPGQLLRNVVVPPVIDSVVVTAGIFMQSPAVGDDRKKSKVSANWR
jgi:hypothetical protein